MDLTESIAPRSDQQNFDDYLAGPRTVTISAVTKGSPEQPVSVDLVEYPGRPFKPNKSMRRVLVSAWGADSSVYVGRRMELFGNPAVIYGGKAVGGVEIAALSHLDKPLNLKLTTTRGKRAPFTVQPLPAEKPAPKQPDTTIPDKVRTDTAAAIAADKIADYLDYLAANNAPGHILEWVKEQTK